MCVVVSIDSLGQETICGTVSRDNGAGPADPYIGHRPYAGPLQLAGSDGPHCECLVRVSKCHSVAIVRRCKIFPKKLKKNSKKKYARLKHFRFFLG